jgi:hypothetical protein
MNICQENYVIANLNGLHRQKPKLFKCQHICEIMGQSTNFIAIISVDICLSVATVATNG